MSEIKLIKPTLEYANDIMEYRQEFIETGDSMAGCSNLRDCSSADFKCLGWAYWLFSSS